MTKHLKILICLALFAASCKQESGSPVSLHQDYFPVDIGKWVEYEVEEINYTTSSTGDTTRYFIKEVYADTFTDNSNRLTYRIERFSKDSLAGEYVIKDVWHANLTTTTAEVVEEGQRFTKMIYPVTRNKYWDGNALNNLVEWEYNYDSIHKPYLINGLSFDSTVKVVQRDNFNAVEFEIAEEVYTKRVGLIYKRYMDLTIDTFNVLDIQGGIDLTMKVIAYGQ